MPRTPRPSTAVVATVWTLVLLALVAAAACRKFRSRHFPRSAATEVTFRAGDRVRLVSRAGAIPPSVTGHARRVACGPGQVGTVVRLEPYTSEDYTAELVRVHWDAQEWREIPSAPWERAGTDGAVAVDGAIRLSEALEHWAVAGPVVQLGAFDEAVHPSYLEHMRAR
jgi:hypothetical protein